MNFIVDEIFSTVNKKYTKRKRSHMSEELAQALMKQLNTLDYNDIRGSKALAKKYDLGVYQLYKFRYDRVKKQWTALDWDEYVLNLFLE